MSLSFRGNYILINKVHIEICGLFLFLQQVIAIASIPYLFKGFRSEAVGC